MSSPTLIYRHDAFTGHDTGPWHPEHPNRVVAIDNELSWRGMLADRPVPTWRPVTDEQILRVHTPDLLARLEALHRSGGGEIDPDTVMRPDSLAAARLSAGAAVAAVEEIAKGIVRTAFVIGRPPGHHATADRAMGFCLLNTVAIAAAHARATGFERVAIVDWDVHHGNGTHDIFYRRSDVLFASTHQYDGSFFPGTGAADETGDGEGAGFTINVPLAAGDGDWDITSAFEQVIVAGLDAFAPDLILISAGYDAHRDDPLGNLNMTDEGFHALTRSVIEVATRHADGRIIGILEGGYHPESSARCVVDTIELLDGAVR
jgi:acetoin utilization deacetylase AcuC-like enzyme